MSEEGSNVSDICYSYIFIGFVLKVKSSVTQVTYVSSRVSFQAICGVVQHWHFYFFHKKDTIIILMYSFYMPAFSHICLLALSYILNLFCHVCLLHLFASHFGKMPNKCVSFLPEADVHSFSWFVLLCNLTHNYLFTMIIHSVILHKTQNTHKRNYLSEYYYIHYAVQILLSELYIA